MHSSFLKRLKFIVSISLVITACSTPDHSWRRVQAVDAGGYAFEFPHEGGQQNGMIQVGKDEVPTHINIAADSGITYISSWFDLPSSWMVLPPAHRSDSVWGLLNGANDATPVNGPSPLGSGTMDQRSGWFLFKDSTRVGVVMTFKDQRVMILNVGVQEAFFRERERYNSLRFLNSFQEL